MRKTCIKEIYRLAKKDKRVIFIGSDLNAGILADFKKEMPKRFLMEGISEANVIGIAAGMAMNGKIPYVNTIATFITRRCFEQVVTDIAMHNLPVRLVGNGGGLVYAPLGPTHLAIDDIAIMKSIPNMTIVAVSDADEMKRFMPETLSYPGPIYIRLGKGDDPIVSVDKLFKIGKAILVSRGKDVLLLTTGICLRIAKEAAEILKKKNVKVTILHMPTIKPLDVGAVVRYAKGVSAVVTVEEGIINGGLGSSIAELVLEKGLATKIGFKRIGIPDKFPDKYGSQADLLNYLGITPSVVASSVMKLVKRKYTKKT